MKIRMFPLLVAALFPLFSTAQAQVILGVDFGVTSSPVQAGYSAFGITSGSIAGPVTNSYTELNTTYTTGTVSITLAAGNTLLGTSNLTARDRLAPSTDSGSFTYSNLYRDFINTSANGNMTIGLTGLNASTAYQLTLYAYDNSNGRTMTFTDFTTGSAGATGSITWTAGATFDSTTLNSVYSTTLNVTSDATGALVIRDIPTGSAPALINGLQLIAVPEPSSIGLCLVAAGGLVLSIRRRSTSAR